MLPSLAQVPVRVGHVAEWTAGQSRQLASVAVFERNDDTVCREAFELVHRVGREARLALLAVGDDGRAGRLEAGDRVLQRVRVERVELLARHATLGCSPDGLDELRRSRDAADRLSRNRHPGQWYG